jgi:hypothetical protein
MLRWLLDPGVSGNGNFVLFIHDEVFPQFCQWKEMRKRTKIFSKNFSDVPEFEKPREDEYIWGFDGIFQEVTSGIPGYRAFATEIWPPTEDEDEKDPDYMTMEEVIYSLGLFLDFCAIGGVALPEKGLPRYFEVESLFPEVNPMARVYEEMYPWLKLVGHGKNIAEVSNGMDEARTFLEGREYTRFSSVTAKDGLLWIHAGNASLGVQAQGYKGLQGECLELYGKDADYSIAQFMLLIGLIEAAQAAEHYNGQWESVTSAE